MQFAIVEEGETLVKLARRIYGACSEPELARAVKELRAANRGLESTELLTAGTVILVPQVEGLSVSESVQTGRSTAVSLIRGLRRQLGDFGSALDPALRQAEVRAEATAKLLETSELRNWERQEPSLRERLVGVAEAAKVQLERSQQLREIQREASEELEADLDALLRMLTPAADRAPTEISRRQG